MKTIHLYTKDNYNFWAKNYSDSELLIKHLVGTRYVYEPQLEDIHKLAKAHGWSVEIHEIKE